MTSSLDSPAPRAEKTRIVINLIPGTWHWLRVSKAERWFDHGSSFCNDLRDILDQVDVEYKIETHQWSGANSIFKRATAAKALAKSIRRRRRTKESDVEFAVGHSHGGSIAMLLSKFLHASDMPHVVTMATPFLEIVPADLTPLDAQRIFSLTFSLVVTGFLAMGSISPEGTPLPNNPTSAGLFGSLIFLCAVGAISSFLFCLLIGFPRKRSFHSSKLLKYTAGGLVMKRGYRILVVRGVDDEAALTMALGAIANRISIGASKLLFSASVFLLFLGGFRGGAAGAYRWGGGALAVSYCLLLLSGLVKAVYGRELLFGSLPLQVATHSSPDQLEQSRTWTLRPWSDKHSRRLGGLRHSIYNHEDVPAAIVSFIQVCCDEFEKKTRSTASSKPISEPSELRRDKR